MHHAAVAVHAAVAAHAAISTAQGALNPQGSALTAEQQQFFARQVQQLMLRLGVSMEEAREALSLLLSHAA
jgi:hypothetical protein